MVRGYPVCYWHGAHRHGGPIDKANSAKHGRYFREELVAVNAYTKLGKAARAVARNVLARVTGAISNDEGAAESERLWGEIAEAQATQKIARRESEASPPRSAAEI